MEVLVIHLTLDSFLNLHNINLNAKMLFKTKRHFYGYIEYLMILQSSVAAGSTLMNQQI